MPRKAYHCAECGTLVDWSGAASREDEELCRSCTRKHRAFELRRLASSLESSGDDEDLATAVEVLRQLDD